MAVEAIDDVPADTRLARVAGAIAEPARARMLCCLLDGHARTATELAAAADVAASTASAHLARLKDEQLVELLAQGRHRYYRLNGSDVAQALEALMVVAGAPRASIRPSTPHRLRAARTCYDHMAGALAVAVHDRLFARRWLAVANDATDGYALTRAGSSGLGALGIDVDAARASRRRLACACVDWSERRPHLAGALGAALLQQMRARGWLQADLDSRALSLTAQGRRGLTASGLLDAASM